ncbi:radical SAM protein with 4Fe4S-binding SPASM domain [Pedobacter sp. AK017]|uniref:radical SAM protein n=1 Tax=Pedobacter sp. AK017 TaxID=2723073 RepID=UPI00160C988D|nr:radical SAM protein [Pedobacter sp. AK017]MBB5441240.1 radical SAM protein with 4Fe4S-binding SPASM domain [Pedobacter sp. AK017]
MFNDLKAPKWIVLQLVEKCNLRCKMCYQWGETGSYLDFKKENLKVLSTSVIKQIVDDCGPVKPYVGLYGGEPLMHPEVFEIIDYLKANQIKMYLDTNGTLIEKHAAQLIDSKVDLLWISLDGPPVINDLQRGNGVYKRVMKGIDKLAELKQQQRALLPKIGISLTVTPLNYQHINALFLENMDLSKIGSISIELQNFATAEEHTDYAKILNDEFKLNTTAPIAKGLVQDPEIFSEMDTVVITNQLIRLKAVCIELGINFNSSLKTLEPGNFKSYFEGNWNEMTDKKHHCSFPLTYAEITAKGDVVVCHTFYDHILGNVYQTSFKDIWNGEALKELRSYLRKQLLPICTACCRYYYNPASNN